MTPTNRNPLLFAVLMMTIVIDVMGMGLVIPVLPGLLLSPHSHLIPESTSLLSRDWLYAITMGVWPLGMFFGNAFVGALSDRLGRKPLLQGSLLGMSLTYGLGWLGIVIHNPFLFIISRLLNGIASGSFVLAQASVIDISPQNRVTQNIGWITFAATFGFVIGPLSSSLMLLILHQLYAPFILATGLALVNLLLLTLLLPKSTQQISKNPTHFLKILFAFTILLRDKRIRILGQTFLIFQIAWGFYVQDIMAFMAQREHLGAVGEALFMSVFGIGSVLNLLLVQPRLLKKYPLKRVAWIGLLAFSILMALFPLYHGIGLWVSAMLLCGANVLLYSALMGLFSSAVGPDEQGQIMGSAGSLFGIAWSINAITLGPLMHWSLYAPIELAVLCLVVAIWRFRGLV